MRSDYIAHYGIFWTDHTIGRDMWARCTNRRTAERHARKVGGYVVRVATGGRMAWDAPTFRVSGDMIADYRVRPAVPV